MARPPRDVRAIAATVLVVTLLAGPTLGTPAPAPAPPNASIDAVAPNPIADEDAGEYVVVSTAEDRTLADLTLADGEQRVTLPNVSGRVLLTGNATALPAMVARRYSTVRELDTWPALANSGERLTLRAGNRTLDSLAYTDAPEGEVAGTTGERLTWRPLGATDFDPVAGGPSAVRAFALPDAPGVAVEALRSAEDRVLLAGYTLTAGRVADALVAARERGVAVSVLVDGSPVGGLTNRSVAVLDELAAANVSVRVLDGPGAPYRFHHAKYAVVDDRALVMTENWKPAGVGGRSSRGWGVLVETPAVVAGLVDTFRADSRPRNTVPWGDFRADIDPQAVAPSNGRYPSRFDAERLRAERVELLTAPDNAAGRVESLLDNATESVRVVQVSVGGPDNRLLRASVRAARRGVDVRLLLSRAWYTTEENRALAENLTRLAAADSLPLSVRLAESRGRFEKIHAKGVLVDGEHVVLGSLNWNRNAFQNNREVALLLSGEAVAEYYGAVFDADWQGGIWRLPAGVVAALALAGLLAVVVGRRIEFRA